MASTDTIAAEIYAFGLIPTDVIRAEVERMDELSNSTRHIISTHSSTVHDESVLLYRYRTELKRRMIAETDADLAKLPAIHADTAEMWAAPILQAAE
jgi:hypothetical protein